MASAFRLRLFSVPVSVIRATYRSTKILINRGAIENARNVTLYFKEKKCQKIGREFEKYVIATQHPGLDWPRCSLDDLN
jgi:hypothetical protein